MDVQGIWVNGEEIQNGLNSGMIDGVISSAYFLSLSGEKAEYFLAFTESVGIDPIPGTAQLFLQCRHSDTDEECTDPDCEPTGLLGLTAAFDPQHRDVLMAWFAVNGVMVACMNMDDELNVEGEDDEHATE